MTPIERAKDQSAHGPKVAAGLCLKMVRGCYGVASRYPDASTAWLHAEHKHRTSNTETIPRGVPIWWTGGSHGYGHVAISAGGGWCWSTDIKRRGFFDRVRVADIQARWGMPLVGWSEDINGVRVWSPPKQEDDMAASDVWDYPITNLQPDGTKIPQAAGKLLTDLEINVDNQAARIAALQRDVTHLRKTSDQILELLKEK